MDILFVGAVVPEDLCTKYKGNSVAGNKMQLGIIQALSKIPDCNIQVLSTYPIASYPTEKILGMRKKNLYLPTGEKIESIPFINIFLIKQLTQIIGLLLGIIRWKKSVPKKNSIIISFNAFPEWSFPVLLLSKLYNIPKICMLADLPFSVLKYSTFREFASILQIKTTFFAIRKFDGLVVLNKNAQNRYAPGIPFCIVDGGINKDDYKEPVNYGDIDNETGNKKVILFAGALIEYNGIINLIEAIKLIRNMDVLFKFYGDGPLREFIINESAHDARIQYCGMVSNQEIIAIQKKSSFLINPRPADALISQVTFPSKMLEYMMSGVPILTTRLDGLIYEYKDLLFFMGDDPKSMANDIEAALQIEKSALVLRSNLAYQYVIQNKNWSVQGEKIHSFSEQVLAKATQK